MQVSPAAIVSAAFWMVRQDKMEPIKLKARKIAEEPVNINGREVWSHKIRLTLTGPLAKLWQAHYWFRKADLVMLQYRGVNGPPGTAETFIELVG